MEPLAEVSLLAVFLVGLLGGAHCAVMCGPVVTTLHLAGRSVPRSNQSTGRLIPIISSPDHGSAVHVTDDANRPVVTRLAYNAGRISMYAVLGSLTGSLGAGAWLVERWVPVQQLVLFLSSFFLIVLGLYLFRVLTVANALESVGRHIWRRIQPLAQKRLFGQGLTNAYIAGALWGLLPCGMVYGAVAMALVSGGAINGALVMAAFGLGTLPNLMLIGTIGERVGAAIYHPIASRIAGAGIIGFGLFGLFRLSMTGSILSPVAS